MFWILDKKIYIWRVKKIFTNGIGRRQFLKTSLSGLAFAAFPSISFAQSNPDVVVIGAGAATAGAFSTVHGANRSGIRAATDLFISPALD